MSAGPNRRLLLAALLVASTVAFVIGVSIERSSDDGHDEPAAATVESSESGDEHAGEGREEAVSETEEEGKRESAAEADGNEDESVLGVDVEATPFVVLAAAVSLGLALAVWLRPDWGLILGLVAAAMLASPPSTRARSSTSSTRTTAASRCSPPWSPRCIWPPPRSRC